MTIVTNTWTKQLVQEHAQTAVAVEIYTLPFYLTALTSIKLPEVKPGQTRPENPPAYNNILSICIEEMLHLQLAANLCLALDTQPIFDAPKYDGTPIQFLRPDNPTTGHHKLINANLDALNETTLELMLDIETPSGLEEHRHPEEEESGQIINKIEAALEERWKIKYHFTPQYPYDTIGEMYDALIAGITVVGTDQFSWKNTNQQAAWSTDKEPFKQTIECFEDAENAVKTISLQGEGTTTDEDSYAVPPNYRLVDEMDSGRLSEYSHYERLLEIKNQANLPEVYPIDSSPNEQKKLAQEEALKQLQLSFDNLLKELDNIWNNGNDINNDDNFWDTMMGLIANAQGCWKVGVVPKWS